MNLQNKTILLISPEPWNHIFVSKHHYATYLAKRGNKVYFLNPPTAQESCEETEYHNVFSVHYQGFIKGLRFFPSLLQRQRIRKKFQKLQKRCRTKFDIVWSFDNSVFFDFSALPQEVYCISHIVDLNQDFNTELAASTANLCIGVIPPLVQRLAKYNDNSFLIGHGVQKFNNQYESITLPGQNTVKALYIGNMDMPHIDWSLMNLLVNQCPKVDFVFLGSKSEHNQAINTLIKKANGFYLPSVPAKELPQYLITADVLLLAYQLAYDSEYATPHKMMEYLASGKMIMATWTAEYEELYQKELFYMSKSADEYLELFKNVVANLDAWNHTDKKKDRIHYALNYTYDKLIERMEQLMSDD
ncbi:hypothetical protein [Marivirga harenae]|uniref:hypothetical protein n=1 Tax=Marivirga harenae TaxID=2010992 RepID=UPI0026E0EF8D|nr:hypothetical protein [Marivirga harenae]WKV13429.1 hypothetical protein Q3Y49_06270 [Marivirga harenae]